MNQVPEVRLIVDPDGVVPPYPVVRHPSGYWYAVPVKKFTDADLDAVDTVALQPGPSAVVDIRYSADGKFGDGSLCDVDVNGKPGARRASVFVAGAFIVSAAVQKEGEPVMVRAEPKTATVTPLKPSPGLSLVQDNG